MAGEVDVNASWAKFLRVRKTHLKHAQ